jgi:hypothetical protein
VAAAAAAERERAKEAAEDAAEAAAEADMAARRARLREKSEIGKALAAKTAAQREQNAAAEAVAQAAEAKRRAAAPSGQAAAAGAPQAAAAAPVKTKYVIVGDQAQGGLPLYFLVAEGRFTDDPTVPSKYALSTASKVWARNPANGKHEYYIPRTNAWQPTAGGRRVLTFRRKPKSRSKNGRRPTRKSSVRRNR